MWEDSEHNMPLTQSLGWFTGHAPSHERGHERPLLPAPPRGAGHRLRLILRQLVRLCRDAYVTHASVMDVQQLEGLSLRMLFPLFLLAQGIALLAIGAPLEYVPVPDAPQGLMRLALFLSLAGGIGIWLVPLPRETLARQAQDGIGEGNAAQDRVQEKPGPVRAWLDRWRVRWPVLRWTMRALAMVVGGLWGWAFVILLARLGVHASTLVTVALLLTDAGIFLISVSCASILYLCLINGPLLWELITLHHQTHKPYYTACTLMVISNLLFVFLASTVLRVLLVGFQANRLFLHQRDRILALLLGGSEEGRRDWLWETDAKGRLQNVSAGLAHMLRASPGSLDGRKFVQVLQHEIRLREKPGQRLSRARRVSVPYSQMASLNHLQDCLERHVFFRNLVICVVVEGKPRYWALSGRPVFHDQVFQGYGGVGTDVTEAHQAQKVALFQARHDVLTGLANRAAFFEDMGAYMVHNAQWSENYALFCLDLDGFKAINDRYGHAAGDEALKIVASRLSGALGEKAQLYRIGGDEFIALVKEAEPDSAAPLAERLLETLASPVVLKDGVPCTLGLSIGIFLGDNSGPQTVEQVLACADLALYESKRIEGSCFSFYKPDMERGLQRDRQLIRDLTTALQEETLDIVYQPYFDLQSQGLLGFEALISWTHPEYGRLPTDEVIKLAEESGLIYEVGLYVLRHAMAFAQTWPETVALSLNVSALQLRTESHREEWVRALLAGGLPLERLQLEVTESIFMDLSPALYAKLDQLRARGVRIVLDDFGKGYSCLAYLNFFPFSKIKLDRLFVSEMLYNPRAAAIVKSTIGLAVDLGLAVTAEGVETVDQYDFLVRLGCTEAQGYYFSRPLRPEAARALMKKAETSDGYPFGTWSHGKPVERSWKSRFLSRKRRRNAKRVA
ncbi:EAL domain-containing protein [Oecophyllibacter saccharovorans]|nr:EAL domain-containing protein [Oecophyllibacter saccharovorans]